MSSTNPVLSASTILTIPRIYILIENNFPSFLQEIAKRDAELLSLLKTNKDSIVPTQKTWLLGQAYSLGCSQSVWELRMQGVNIAEATKKSNTIMLDFISELEGKPSRKKLPEILAKFHAHGFDMRDCPRYLYVPPEETSLPSSSIETDVWINDSTTESQTLSPLESRTYAQALFLKIYGITEKAHNLNQYYDGETLTPATSTDDMAKIQQIMKLLQTEGVQFTQYHLDVLLSRMAYCGAYHIAHALIVKGANVNFDLTFTPLNAAIFGTKAQLVKLLLENGADPEIIDKDGSGESALHTAIIQFSSHNSGSHSSQTEDQKNIIEMLVMHGADIEKTKKAIHTAHQSECLGPWEDYLETCKASLVNKKYDNKLIEAIQILKDQASKYFSCTGNDEEMKLYNTLGHQFSSAAGLLQAALYENLDKYVISNPTVLEYLNPTIYETLVAEGKLHIEVAEAIIKNLCGIKTSSMHNSAHAWRHSEEAGAGAGSGAGHEFTNTKPDDKF